MAEFDNNEQREDIFSKAVRAGKRTYFFDVRATRKNDYYLTITESVKQFGDEGEKPFYRKHKIFLYREDFEKFSEGLTEVVDFILKKSPPEERVSSDSTPPPSTETNRFTDVDFDDLGETK